MYKTIRHGENSLQYTILPQNDDIRMDGKLTSASSSSSNSSISNTGNCHRIKRNGGKNKKSFYTYLGLLFVCTVIIGAILIPFLVSAECLPNPSDWFLKTRVAISNHINNNSNNSNNNNNNNNKTNQIKKINNNNSNFSTTLTTTTTTTTIIISNPNNNLNISNSTDTSNTINKSYPNANNLELGLNDDIPTTTTTTTTTANIQKNYNNLIINKQILNKNNYNNDIYKYENDNDLIDNDNNENNKIDQITKDTLINNAILIPIQQNNTKQIEEEQPNIITDNIVQSKIDTSDESIPITEHTLDKITTEQVNKININNLTNNRKLLQPTISQISITKKPIILPVLAKTNSVIKENGVIIPSEHNESKNWIKSHWPFIDPSTYFQWTGYKSEDSVILPAILGITLIGIIFILTLCLVARNKRKIVASVRKRNRNKNIDETGEDNATLLTTANLSDADDE